MEQQGQELDSWAEIVEKTINAKAKASLQPTLFIKQIHQ